MAASAARSALLLSALMAQTACQTPASPPDSTRGEGGGAGETGTDADSDLGLPCEESRLHPCPPPGYATWPMPHPPSVPLPHPASFTSTEETAVDDVTGLEWQRTHSEKVNWEDANRNCETLVIGQRSDWRLPSRIELVSLVEYTARPTANADAFAGTPLDYFWSSSSVRPDEMLAYSVYFGAGNTTFAVKTGATGHGRCVRGGNAGKSTRWSSDTETVFDENTRLRWQRTIPRTALSFESAARYCDDLELDGQGGYRLPSTKELQTIVHEGRHDPSIDQHLFPGTPAERFWTGTRLDPTNDDEVFYVEFSRGTTEGAPTSEALWVRCVR